MVIGIFLGEKRYLGIDMGSFSIKIVEVVDRKGSIEVVNFGLIPIVNFKQVFSTSRILEETLSSLLKESFNKFKIQAKEAIFNITAPNTFPINFLVPYIPERSLMQVVKFESQKQVPLSLEEIEFEFRYTEFLSETQKNWLVFLVAVPKTYFQRLENLTNLTKLKLSGYGLEYFNLEPFFASKKEVLVCFDLGHSYSTIYLIKDGKIIYGSKLNLRGYDYLDGVMNISKFNEEKTIELVQKKGFMFNPEERELKNLAENFLNNLITSVEMEISKIEDKFLFRPEKIIFTGGLSVLNGFKENVALRLKKYQFEILDITSFVKGDNFIKLKEKSSLFSQALGVVFRKIIK